MTYNFKPPKLLTLPEDTAIDAELVTKLIQEHKANEVPRYEYLMNMYLNQPEIVNQKAKEYGKPDNRVPVNFSRKIVDDFAGYFIGISVKKSLGEKEQEVLDVINRFDNLNDMDDEDQELTRLASIYGRCYQYMYQDEEARTRVYNASPVNTVMVYSDAIRRTPLLAINYSINSDGNLEGTLYTRSDIITLGGKLEKLTMSEVAINPYGRVPVNEFYLNEQRVGLFEGAIPLINAYNKALSEKANDVEYFSDSYLKVLGAEIDEATIKNIRDNRVINLWGLDRASDVEVDFLDKPDSDAQTENLLDRLERLIYTTCSVANISDENFGNASGTSLAYKLESQSNLALSIERKFTRSFNRRYKLFLSLVTNVPKQHADVWQDLVYKFTRNEPKNVLEESQVALNLSNLVSEETALSALSIVDDPAKELEKMKESQKAALKAIDPYAEVSE